MNDHDRLLKHLGGVACALALAIKPLNDGTIPAQRNRSVEGCLTDTCIKVEQALDCLREARACLRRDMEMEEDKER